MPLKTINSAPDASSWSTLSEHQSSTPASFSTPVLHLHCTNTQIALSSDQKYQIPDFFPDETIPSSSASAPPAQQNSTIDDQTEDKDEEVEEEWEEDHGPMIQDVTIENVDIFVTSTLVTLTAKCTCSMFV